MPIANERNQLEPATYCMIQIVWLSWKSKTMETVKIPGGLGEGERKKQCTVMFRVWHQPVWYITVDKWTTLRGNPKVNHGPGVIGLCQCRFINWNECARLVGAVDHRGGCVCVCGGQQVSKKSLYLPQNSVVDLKLLQKVKKKSRGHCDDKNTSSFTVCVSK